MPSISILALLIECDSLPALLLPPAEAVASPILASSEAKRVTNASRQHRNLGIKAKSEAASSHLLDYLALGSKSGSSAFLSAVLTANGPRMSCDKSHWLHTIRRRWQKLAEAQVHELRTDAQNVARAEAKTACTVPVLRLDSGCNPSWKSAGSRRLVPILLALRSAQLPQAATATARTETAKRLAPCRFAALQLAAK